MSAGEHLRGAGDRPGRVMRMAKTAYRHMHCSLGRRPPEAGGLLLGPIGCTLVTHFHFDDSAVCTGLTYTPNHIALGRLMKERWLPAGLDMKGAAHSHPSGLARLSHGDLAYIARLLTANPDMDEFLAPIILPDSFRICPFIVDRRDPTVGHAAVLELI